jgi:hypothetical protein
MAEVEGKMLLPDAFQGTCPSTSVVLQVFNIPLHTASDTSFHFIG